MSNHSRRQQQPASSGLPHSNLAALEQELAEGYMEVEITGLTFGRLAAAYLILARNAWAQTMEGVRSLLRPTPAH